MVDRASLHDVTAKALPHVASGRLLLKPDAITDVHPKTKEIIISHKNSGVITRDEIERFDSSDMHKIYDRWPDIALKAFHTRHDTRDFGDVSHIVFAGMGGSGTIGDIFDAVFSKTNVHVSVVKGYLLPKTVDRDTIVVSTSISGNTVETLSILKRSLEIGCRNVVITGGGRMKEFCTQNGIDFNTAEMIHSPRSSFPSFLYSTLGILREIIPLKEGDIINSIDVLGRTRDTISSENLSGSNHALELAEEIGEIPLIYYPHGLQASAIRFKNSLQENAKNHAIVEDVIESSHNGIVAWERRSAIKPILVRGDEDYVKTKERWRILKEYFEANSVGYKEVFSVSGNILTKLINLIYIFDYASIYRAVLSKTDPAPIRSIDFVKSRLQD